MEERTLNLRTSLQVRYYYLQMLSLIFFFCFTTEPTSYRTAAYEFEATGAKVINGKIVANKPSSGLKVWFLTVTDEKGSTVSSHVAINNEIPKAPKVISLKSIK